MPMESLSSHWEALQSNMPSGSIRVLRDGLCHELVEAVSVFFSATCSSIPSLPTVTHVHEEHATTLLCCQYVSLTNYQSSHSRLVPLSDESADFGSDFESERGKYESLATGARVSCFSNINAVNFGTCSSGDFRAWWDHLESCSVRALRAHNLHCNVLAPALRWWIINWSKLRSDDQFRTTLNRCSTVSLMKAFALKSSSALWTSSSPPFSEISSSFRR